MNQKFHERIANRIKLLRLQDPPKTQDFISKKLNMSRSAYSKLETGETKLNYELAIELAQLHTVDVEYFYSENPVTINQ